MQSKAKVGELISHSLHELIKPYAKWIDMLEVAQNPLCGTSAHILRNLVDRKGLVTEENKAGLLLIAIRARVNASNEIDKAENAVKGLDDYQKAEDSELLIRLIKQYVLSTNHTRRRS